MNDGGVVINGSVTMTGDISMGSSDVINGDVVAHNVTTKSSNTSINGNAAVNAIYLDWNTSVTKTITCTGAPANAASCSCVTKADPNYKPTCGAAAPSSADHILITHNGQGLTCQAQPVTLRACADANCSSTYTGSSTVTLTPGGGSITFNGTTNASVRQSVAGTATLSAGSGTVCLNAAANNNSCAMVFSDSGLLLSTTDHVSMSGATLTIQARKSGPNNGTCVPLVQNTTTKINFSCGYMNPASGSLPLALGSAATQIACNGATTAIDVAFDNTGLGTAALQYPDVGLVSVNASYSSANLGASGSTSFTAAPQSFKISATPDPAVTINANAFARASDPFRLTVTAVNALGNATPNFGKESAPESFIISQTLKLPSDGVSGTSSQGKFQAISNGVSKSTTDASGLWVFGEAGTITLSAKLANSSSYYLGKTLTGFQTAGTLDLRFLPHHFDTLLIDGIPMSCTNLGGYSNPCAPSNTSGSFVYTRQPFALQVKVYKDATTLSQNYRLRTPGKGDSDDVARSPTLSLAQPTGGTSIASISFKSTPSLVFAQGIAQLTGANMPSLQFKSEPSTATTALLRASDADNVSSQLAGAVEAPLTAVSGKMLISNAYGPASTPIPVEARAMYWSSAAGAWLFNPVFAPQSPALGAAADLQAGDGTFTTCSGGLNCSNLSLKASTLQFKNGKAVFQVAAPSPAASGRVQVGLKQAADASKQPLFMDNNFPYLPIDVGTVTFGTARPSPVIYTREVYN
jgi:MSHA biogenesis protein MshQ